jgi:heme/copper-type cytochrome/quinol oxidase subunit 4
MASIAKKRDRTELRWPAAGAVLFSLALYAFLPSAFLPVFRYSVVGLCLLLLIPVIATNPIRLEKQTLWSRRASIAVTVVLAIANHIALIQLIYALLHAKKDDSGTLLLAAVQVWVTLVIVYALIYWEMDRGGPVIRTTAPRDELPIADIRFPQDEDGDAIIEVAKGSSKESDWTASFVDYAYFALSNSMAFSPPDALPLSGRAKILVGLQALAAYVILVLVIARAVSLLG